jgi:hypothetical protein
MQRRAAEKARERTAAMPDPSGPAVCALSYGSCFGGLHRHHVARRSQGGADEPGNLRWLCARHHAWVHEHVVEARALGLLA